MRDPLAEALAFIDAYGAPRNDAEPDSFDEVDLREANRGGARISAVEQAAILERRAEIERALRAIPPTASLMSPPGSVPWPPLLRVLGSFAGIRGVGLAKTTNALHPKRPALVPMLDSVVQQYLGAGRETRSAERFAERAIELVRIYKSDLDRNAHVLRELKRELADRGYGLTEVRILDVLIWSTRSAA